MKFLYPLLICYSLMNAGVCSASSLRVEQDGSGDFLTLQSAVDVAASGDTILIGPGWYQDMQWGSHGVLFLARWTDSKDLTFIGESADTVILGPDSYAPIADGPIGIYSDTLDLNNVVVKSVTLKNMHTGILGFGELIVENCRFETGDTGVVYIGTSSAEIRGCDFNGFTYSCLLKNFESALVEYCQLGRGRIQFENVNDGKILNCDAIGGGLASYVNSGGTISECNADSPAGACVTAGFGSTLLIVDSTLESEAACIRTSGVDTEVIVNNSILRGGTFAAIVAESHASFKAKDCDIYRHFIGEHVVYAWGYTNESLEYEIDVTGNYWGNVGPDAFYIDDYIWDQNDDPNNKIIVNYAPVEGGPVPTEGTNWGSVKAMFR